MESLILTLRGIERSGALDTRIREIFERLQRCNDRLISCHVTLVRDPAGDPAAVEAKIHLSVPGAQIHADSLDCRGEPHTDVFSALRDAYDSARRQLRDLKRDGTRSSFVDAVRKFTSRRTT